MENQEPLFEVNPIGDKIVTKLKALVGEEANNPIVQKLISALRFGGKEQAKIFLWNEADKFRSASNLIEFCEREIFDVDESGVNVETPWNMSKRMMAKRQKKN